MLNPLISYITVVWNEKDRIDETMNSIIPFRSEKVEYLVVDGLSTDGTRERIAAKEGQIDRWVSEKDKGIYDAMNKGLAMASGKFVCFINAGDRLLVCPKQQIAEADAQQADAVAFAVEQTDGRTRRPEFSGKLRWENTLHHQGLYYRRATSGTYDTRFKVFADFDLNQRLLLSGKKVQVFPDIVNASHSTDGVSNNPQVFDEIFAVIGKNFGTTQAFLSKIYFKMKYGLASRFRNK